MPARSPLTLEQRLWARVYLPPCEDDCWTWTGGQTKGYGFLMSKRRKVIVHRLSYELARGPIPDGLQIDHLCRNRGCVNPSHLEVVTQRVNVLRGVSFSAVNAKKVICSRGHPFNEENTYVRASGVRQCRACRRIYDHRRRPGLSRA